jgi:hypothetical protein
MQARCPVPTTSSEDLPDSAIVQLPALRTAEVAITLDDTRIFIHIGPTRATVDDAMQILQDAAERLKLGDQAQAAGEARRAA